MLMNKPRSRLKEMDVGGDGVQLLNPFQPPPAG